MKQLKNPCNGWRSRETWNISLWINNDEPLYRSAVEFVKNHKGHAIYRNFIYFSNLSDKMTPDGIDWLSNKVCYSELNSMMRELYNRIESAF